ncbi:MAG TPA: ankyrin repeat domain-containing protein [Gemmatimonadaceae bacterium]|nr:ankyrin repeat domain-containing protein [Gemmatimonadaceae bacterium]
MPSSSAAGGPAGTPAPRQTLPERPSLDHLRKEAKDLLRAARAEDSGALARIRAVKHRPSDRVILAEAQFTIAREYGFASWADLVQHVGKISGAAFVLRPLIRPVEMPSGKRHKLSDDLEVPNDDIYAMFAAARDGDLATVRELVSRAPAMATVEYNYTPPIHFAVREGHRAIAELLLENGADPAYRSYPFQESLLTFAEDRGHDDLAEFLRGRLARRFALAPGTRALIDASKSGDLAAVKVVLERDPGLAAKSDETGNTALHEASRHGHIDLVRLLIERGAQADAVRGDGWRPIHCALMPDRRARVPLALREGIARLLLAHGARYTIYIAASLGDVSYVRASLARDRSLANFEDTCHYRPISAAVRRGDVAMTRLLLEHGADPNAPEEGAPRGNALWTAVHDRQRAIVNLLLAHGADPNAPVESSGTPMLPAEGDAELTALLEQHGGRPQRADAGQERVGALIKEGRLDEAERMLRANLHWIHDDSAGWGDGVMAGPARDGRNDVVSMLLRLGARVPKVSKWAPYYYFKHEATARLLLEHGMDPNHMNWHRFTLLHHMAADGEVAKAKLLLDHGADIDAVDDEYRSTPLGVAARWGRREMVELLLERGADPTASGASWAVPMAWAERKGHRRITEILTQSGHRSRR